MQEVITRYVYQFSMCMCEQQKEVFNGRTGVVTCAMFVLGLNLLLFVTQQPGEQ